MQFRKPAALSAAGLAAIVSAPAFAQATGPDFTTLTDAVDVSTTITAILSVGALMVGVALVVMGVRKIISMSKGGA